MGILVYSFLRVMQDLYHQPCPFFLVFGFDKETPNKKEKATTGEPRKNPKPLNP